MMFDSLPGLWLITNRFQEFSPIDRARLEEICHNFFQYHIENYGISPESLALQLRKCDELEFILRLELSGLLGQAIGSDRMALLRPSFAASDADYQTHLEKLARQLSGETI